MDRKSLTFFLLLSLLVVNSLCASLHARRAIEDTIATNTENICQRSTPCGWAVYKKYTRVIDFFMKNKCECPEGKSCIRTDDDISVSAYVYRCKDADNPKNKNQS